VVTERADTITEVVKRLGASTTVTALRRRPEEMVNGRVVVASPPQED